jgi:hypothetical protein
MKPVLLVVCGVLLFLVAGDMTLPQERTKGLSRTIEGFTLGMSKDEAWAIVRDRLRKATLTVLVRPENDWTRSFRIHGGQYPSSLGFIEAEFYPERSPGDGKGEINDIYGKIGQLEQSAVFKSGTTKSITLNFYKLKLYKIDILPLVEYDIMYKALLEKYGLSQEVYTHPGRNSWKVYEWKDKETTIRTCNCQGIPLEDGTLFYIDNALYAQVRQAASAAKKPLEEKEQRPQHTLPKQY